MFGSNAATAAAAEDWGQRLATSATDAYKRHVATRVAFYEQHPEGTAGLLEQHHEQHREGVRRYFESKGGEWRRRMRRPNAKRDFWVVSCKGAGGGLRGGGA